MSVVNDRVRGEDWADFNFRKTPFVFEPAHTFGSIFRDFTEHFLGVFAKIQSK